jgi:arylsulfatase A-like enzyme
MLHSAVGKTDEARFQMNLWPSAEGICRARWSALSGAALCLMLLVWLPIVAIQLLDKLTPFMTGAEVLDLLALGVLVLIALCGLLAGAAWLTGALLAFMHPMLGRVVAWLLVLGPVVALSFWKVGAATKFWMEQVFGLRISLSSTQKAIWTLLICACLLAALYHWNKRHPRAISRGLVNMLLTSLPLAGFLVLVTIGWMAWRSPFLDQPAERQTAPMSAHMNASTVKRPDIILISIDALSEADADLCGTLGSLMPNLRKLASQSSCFTQFYASSNYTIPTTSTMETGLLPWTHWAVNFDSSLPGIYRNRSLSASLQAAGYSTHSISANQWASPRQHGTWRSYDSHEIPSSSSWAYNLAAKMTDLIPNGNLPLLGLAMFPFLLELDIHFRGSHSPWKSETIYAHGEERLFQQHSTAPEKPLFLWLHSMPPHSPYLPPESTRYRLLPKGQLDHWKDLMHDNVEYPPSAQSLVDAHRLRYRESIMAADIAIGQFLKELQATGRFDGATIIVTSDHGESFEKGFFGHTSKRLHNALIRIPLVIKLPMQKSGQLVTNPFSQADLTPTLIDLAQAKPQMAMDGRSILPQLRGESLRSAPVFSMSLERESRFKAVRRGQFVMIDGPFKLTHDRESGSTTLHDLAADPLELADIAAQRPAEAARMKQELDRRIQSADAQRALNFNP